MGIEVERVIDASIEYIVQHKVQGMNAVKCVALHLAGLPVGKPARYRRFGQMFEQMGVTGG